jgi:hypothetical protein
MGRRFWIAAGVAALAVGGIASAPGTRVLVTNPAKLSGFPN